MQLKAVILMVLFLAGAVQAQEAGDKSVSTQPAAEKAAAKEPTGMEILDRADRALRRVKLVRYKARFEGSGWMAPRSPTVEGEAIVGGMSEKGLDKYRVTGTLQPFDGPKTREITTASDGHMYYLLNNATKTLHASTDPKTVGSSGGGLKALAFPYFSHPRPLSVEMNMDKATLLGTTMVEGEECYEVHLMNLRDELEAIWCFSKKDFLPRRREMILVELHEKATLTWTLFDVQVDPKLDGNPFKLAVPDGYTKTDKPGT